MSRDSDARIRRAVEGFVNGYDGPTAKLFQAGFDELERALAAEGRMLDGDFLKEMLRKLPHDVSPDLIDMLRCSFFLGASSTMSVVDMSIALGLAPEDVQRIDNLRAEIEVFRRALNRLAETSAAMKMKTAGSA
jgi:hypothetical protein